MTPNSFCHQCGTQYEALEWPRSCKKCGHMEWRRTNPVAVLIQRVLFFENGKQQLGILLGRRGIQPGLGIFGLPGGHVEFGEQPEDAVVRELYEEMGLTISRADINYSHSYTDDKGHLLLFFAGRPRYIHDLGEFVPSIECTEMLITKTPIELAFQSHTEALANDMKIWPLPHK